jgi:phytoene desaturase
MILLSHPSLTDPGLAPPGKSVLSATVPVANLAKLPIDWDTVGPVLQRRVLKEVGRRLVPDIEDRVVTAFHTTPRDLALDFNAWAGAGWGLEASPLQSGPLRPHHRDGKLANLYLVGAGTHPGAGLAAVLAGAKATARLIVETKR